MPISPVFTFWSGRESEACILSRVALKESTGTTPFVNEATEEGGYAAAIRALAEDLPDTRQAGVPDQIASAIELATDRDPDRRPNMVDLARLLRGETTASELTA